LKKLWRGGIVDAKVMEASTGALLDELGYYYRIDALTHKAIEH